MRTGDGATLQGDAPVLTIAQIERLYQTPLADLGEHTPTLGATPTPTPRRGVLLCMGAGLMMGTLDHHPLRYYADLDTMPSSPATRLSDAMQMWARYHPPLAVMGWWSMGVPAVIRQGCAAIEGNGDAAGLLVYSGGGDQAPPLASAQWTDLATFYRRLGRHLSAPDKKRGRPSAPRNV